MTPHCSDTLLLKRARYEFEREGKTVRVEVRLEKGQRIQRRMLTRAGRVDGGLLTRHHLRLRRPRQDDGTFVGATSSN